MINTIFLYAGHHKCASAYITAILNSIAAILNMQVETAMDSETLLAKKDIVKNVDFFYLLNANFSIAKTTFEHFDNIKGFHVIRDPRDLLVSAYFSHLYSHPTKGWDVLTPHRAKLNTLNKKDGIISELEFCSEWMNDLYSWNYYENPNILDLRFEQIIENPYSIWLKVLEHLNILNKDSHTNDSRSISFKLFRKIKTKMGFKEIYNKKKKITPHTILGIVYNNRFETLAKGRDVGNEDSKHHYRKGIAGDWLNHFDDELIQCFKEKYNHMILKLGYESEVNWEDKYHIKTRY